MFRIDDYTSELRVIDDSNQFWTCHIHNMKYRFLREGQYVKIRGATLEHHERSASGRSFGLKNYSNIMSLPYPSKIAQAMRIDVAGLTKEFEREQLLLVDTLNLHPIIVTRVTNEKYAHLPLTSLDEILDSEGTKSSVFRTRLSVLAIRPQIILTGGDFKPDSIASLVKI